MLATIMCLLGSQRSQTLASLQTNSIYTDEYCVIFDLSKLTKSSRPNFHQKLLEFLAYLSDNLLCVVKMTKLNLDKTSRNKDMYSFFIRYVAPC